MSTYNRVVAADETASLAPAVRARLATEMADPASDVGASLSGTFGRALTQQTVAYLGDSYSPPSTYAYGTAPHWAGVARSTLGHRYTDGVSAGVGGETSTQIAARVGSVTVSAPSLCLVAAGSNDLAAASAASTVIANLQTIIDALVLNGIKPIILTVPPSVNINTAAKLTECTAVNEWIKSLPASQGVMSIDWRAAVVNFSSVTAAWQAGLTTDGIHPNDLGHTVLGRAVATALAPMISGPSPMLSDAGANASLLSLNPGMTGSGGVAGPGVTGTVPASWNVSPAGSTTTTASVEPRVDDVGGNWLKLDVTAGDVWVYQQTTAVDVDWAVGDTVWAEVELYIPNTPANFRGPQMNLQYWNGAGSDSDFTFTQAPAVVSPIVGSENVYVLRTKKTAVPATTARLQMFLFLYSSGTPTYTVRVGRLAIRKQV